MKSIFLSFICDMWIICSWQLVFCFLCLNIIIFFTHYVWDICFLVRANGCDQCLFSINYISLYSIIFVFFLKSFIFEIHRSKKKMFYGGPLKQLQSNNDSDVIIVLIWMFSMVNGCPLLLDFKLWFWCRIIYQLVKKHMNMIHESMIRDSSAILLALTLTCSLSLMNKNCFWRQLCLPLCMLLFPEYFNNSKNAACLKWEAVTKLN